MQLLAGAALILAGLSRSAAAGGWGPKWGQQPGSAAGVPYSRLLAENLTENGCVPRNPIGALDWNRKDCTWYAARVYMCGVFDDEDFSAALCEQCTPGLVLCPRSLEEELARLPSDVEHISWNAQSLTGRLPVDLAQRFPDLIELSLNENQLEGEIPEGVWSLPRLQVLHLAGNRLVGSLPEAAGQASGLLFLNLNGNRLAGPLPAAVGGWTQLVSLRLSGNMFSGGLPAALASWSKVEEVDLSHNTFSGGLPEEVLGAWPNLEWLYLNDNRFNGPIPAAVGRWTKVIDVRLDQNELSGLIPEDVGQWQRVRYVVLGDNKLTGGLPAAARNWSEVETVRLNNNMLSGSLPEDVLAAWPNLFLLYLQNNRFSGPIPRAVGRWTKVNDVWLFSNELTGGLLAEMANWTQVETVNLASNMLSGGLPEDVLGAWSKLKGLFLDDNRFSGPIPKAVGRWVNVVDVSIAWNELSGPIPEEVGQWQRVDFVQLSHNKLTGPLPAAVGRWTRMTVIKVNKNGFSGKLPAEIGKWRNVVTVEMAVNQLTGQLPPEIGNWALAFQVDLSHNNFVGKLPQEFAGMVGLEEASLFGNRIEGELPDLSGLLHLKKLNLANNSITGTGPLPPNLRTLNLVSNKLATLPEAVYELQELELLDVSNNNIGRWPPRGVIKGKFDRAGNTICGLRPEERRFALPKLKVLDASNNPMVGTEARSFLGSLAYLTSLTDLECRNCQLGGVLHREVNDGLADDLEDTGDDECNGQRISAGFVGLQSLDLSGNSITEILAVPSVGLLAADFSQNALERLVSLWFNTYQANRLISLNVAGNPALRSQVMLPAGRCSSSGSSVLVADPYAYASQVEDHECTQLCPGIKTRYTLDSALNVSALCRCKPGFGGQGVDCNACAADTYSSSEDSDEYEVVRKCKQCPEGSTTGGQARSTSITSCLCPPGTFLNRSAASCAWCPQWPFRSTRVSGETQASACTCNASYTGLKEFGGICGCDDGTYMNHRTRSCERCSTAERCTWATEIQRSLLPPMLKPGHWAAPVTELASFEKHSIWRCASQESCEEGGVCAEGREGHACGLCQAGHYGGPDGPCDACDEYTTPTSRRWSLALGTLAVLVPVVVLLHMGLIAKDDGVQMGLHLEATFGSVKQMVKHIQTISIIGGLSVSWPPVAQAFFEALKRFTVNIPAILRIGCLSDQTSVALEMGFKWIMPLAFVSVTAVAMPFSHLASLAIRFLKRRFPRVLRRLPQPEKVAMGPADAARVLLFTLTIFWTTLASNCMEMLTCVPSPNGKFTVDTYPQVLCSLKNSDFVAMGVISLLAAVLYLLVPLKVLWMGYIRTTKHLAMSDRCERGWFQFLFQDFRDGHLLWLVEIMAKDASFVLVPVVLPGQGAGQLLLIAGLSAAHVCAVLQSTPFRDRSNSLLEAWNGATGAALCIYSVGMGYQKEVGMEEIEELFPDGKEDPLYRGRASGMVAVQVIAVGVPVLFLLYQLFCALERTRVLLPGWLRPPSHEDSKQWLEAFFAEDAELRQAPFAGVIRRFDFVDLHHFRTLVEHSSATLGHNLSKTSRSYLVRLHSEISRASSRASREDEGEELDPMDEEPEGVRRRSLESPRERAVSV